jgi:DNA polymerase-1
MCFSDYPTFRHGIYQEYKANRSAKRRPLGLSDIREQIAKDFHSISFDGLEGDDVMGLLATGGKYKDPIIVSPDKDMRGVPCTLLQSDDLELITRKKADRHWMIQTLSGDKTDNIEGLVGVGPVTAEKILGDSQTLEDMWEKVLQAYKKKKKSYADAIMTARLTRILRDGEYNHTSGEVQLWEPAL